MQPPRDVQEHSRSVPELQLPPPQRKSDWRRAWRAMQEVLESDGDDTAKAFEFSRAIDGDCGERVFQRFLREPGAPELLRERPSLLDALSYEKLAALQEGSFGRMVLGHFERNQLDPRTLALLHAESIAGDPPLDSAREWFRLRVVLMHDLWHTLSGYGSDELGETALLWFSAAQTGARSGVVLSLGAGVKFWGQGGRGWPAYVAQAWRRGRRAVGLFSLRYEELLPEPLHIVRSAAGISPPAIAHRRGVLCLNETGGVERTSPDLVPVACEPTRGREEAPAERQQSC